MRTENVQSLFREHGIRCTRQRLAVYSALTRCRSHPTAEELYQMVQSSEEKLSLATVYNTLSRLCMAGLCEKLPTPGGSTRYDADVSHHLHIRVDPTGEVLDLPEDLGRELLGAIPAELLQRIERRMRVTVESLSIQIRAGRE